MGGTVIAVSCSLTHTFSKTNQGSIRLLTGLGVEGDAHFGERVQRRSRVVRDPTPYWAKIRSLQWCVEGLSYQAGTAPAFLFSGF
jgi:hypothetical protein